MFCCHHVVVLLLLEIKEYNMFGLFLWKEKYTLCGKSLRQPSLLDEEEMKKKERHWTTETTLTDRGNKMFMNRINNSKLECLLWSRVWFRGALKCTLQHYSGNVSLASHILRSIHQKGDCFYYFIESEASRSNHADPQRCTFSLRASSYKEWSGAATFKNLFNTSAY